jgi:hypothetical protein
VHDARVRVSGYRACGICRPDPVCAFWDCALAAEAPQRAIPGTAAAGLRGDDLAEWDQVPAPVVPFQVRANDRN